MKIDIDKIDLNKETLKEMFVLVFVISLFLALVAIEMIPLGTLYAGLAREKKEF